MFTHVRKRLLDWENLCAKWITDALCRTNDPLTGQPFLPGDAPQQVYVRNDQRKCRPGEEEHVLIEIYV